MQRLKVYLGLFSYGKKRKIKQHQEAYPTHVEVPYAHQHNGTMPGHCPPCLQLPQ